MNIGIARLGYNVICFKVACYMSSSVLFSTVIPSRRTKEKKKGVIKDVLAGLVGFALVL